MKNKKHIYYRFGVVEVHRNQKPVPLCYNIGLRLDIDFIERRRLRSLNNNNKK